MNLSPISPAPRLATFPEGRNPGVAVGGGPTVIQMADAPELVIASVAFLAGVATNASSDCAGSVARWRGHWAASRLDDAGWSWDDQRRRAAGWAGAELEEFRAGVRAA